MDLRQCIRACLDCADICDATYKVATRRTGNNELLLQEMLQLCITACDICAEECARHDNDHCRLCAEMCRECGTDCRAALETFCQLCLGEALARNPISGRCIVTD